MDQRTLTSSSSLGADIRALRRTRGLTLSALSHKLKRSVGWLSQVERDKSEPSISDLREISQALGVPMSLLFGQPSACVQEQGVVVRAGDRRAMGCSAQGLVEELLSPDLTDDFEMVHSTFKPHSAMKTPTRRPTQEVGYLVSGTLDLTIGLRHFTVHTGDSFRIKHDSYTWANPYDEPAVAIWVIAPPIY